MPYIEEWRRQDLDYIVEDLSRNNCGSPNGNLNYILFALCKRHTPQSYNEYKNFIGELRQCATEIERRLLAPYEDLKISENGDV